MSSVLKIIEIDGQEVKMTKQPTEILNTRTNFNGQKLFHPFETTNVVKIGKNNKQTTELVYSNVFKDDAQDDIINAVRIDMKHDGSCGFLFFDDVKKQFVPYTRYDVKRNKDGKFSESPKNSIPCEPKPDDDNAEATHWPHFVPVHDESGKPQAQYKWNIHAFDNAVKSGKLENIQQSFTVEYMGKKFNYKPCDGVEMDGVIVPHGLITFDIPVELRTYDGFKKIFDKFDCIEGLVVYGKKNIWKIRREMFVTTLGGTERLNGHRLRLKKFLKQSCWYKYKKIDFINIWIFFYYFIITNYGKLFYKKNTK